MSTPIPEKTENPEGLHRKFNVTKADGSPVDPGAEYFLLRLDEDADPKYREASKLAILTFAGAIETTIPKLAADIRERYGFQTLDRSNDAPCLACPVQVRGLYAVAHNLTTLYHSGDPDRIRRKLHERMQELEDALKQLTPFVEAHFENRAHAHNPQLESARTPAAP